MHMLQKKKWVVNSYMVLLLFSFGLKKDIKSFIGSFNLIPLQVIIGPKVHDLVQSAGGSVRPGLPQIIKQNLYRTPKSVFVSQYENNIAV